MTQNEALAIMLAGNSVLLTGAAGTGKTYTLNKFIRLARAQGKAVSVTATTGLAATHINGCTIHSWSGLGIKSSINNSFIDNLPKNRQQIINGTNVLIIDEVSMLHNYRLDLVNAICQRIKQNDLPFGGIQMIFCGDFFQLPPINENDDDGNSFITNSNAWSSLKPDICYLKQQYRQKDDDEYSSLLNGIRSGYLRPSQINSIKNRLGISPEKSEQMAITRIYTINRDVDAVNRSRLAKITAEEKVFYASYGGRKNKIELLKKSSLASDALALKVGAFVMFIKNSPDKKYINGSLGIVKKFDSATGYPVIALNNGQEILAKPDTWELTDGEKTVASMTQLPLKLAWAITVHKSQGMSLDSAVIDLSGSFVEGMGYVALSRVKKLNNLFLEGINRTALQVSQIAKQLNQEFIEASNESIKKHSQIIANYIEEPIIAKPQLSSKAKSWSDKLATMRKQYPNAYKPWTDSQDKKLVKLFSDGENLSYISKKMGRHTGSIKARLEKHFGEDIFEDVTANEPRARHQKLNR